MVKKYRALLITSLLVSCNRSDPSWVWESLPNSREFLDASRLTYRSQQPYPPIRFELLKVGDKVEARISLNHFHFTSEEVQIEFWVGATKWEDRVQVREGAMRTQLAKETVEHIIQALQDGHEIIILVDGFEETLTPGEFKKIYSQFTRETS